MLNFEFFLSLNYPKLNYSFEVKLQDYCRFEFRFFGDEQYFQVFMTGVYFSGYNLKAELDNKQIFQKGFCFYWDKSSFVHHYRIHLVTLCEILSIKCVLTWKITLKFWRIKDLASLLIDLILILTIFGFS